MGVLSPDSMRMLEDIYWTPQRANARAAGMAYVAPRSPLRELQLPMVIEPRVTSPPAIRVPTTLPTLNDLTAGRFTPDSPR